MALTLIRADEAAWWTGRPVGTIWRWASEGRISRYGTGKSARYHLDELPRARRDEHTGEILEVPPAPPLPAGCRAA